MRGQDHSKNTTLRFIRGFAASVLSVKIRVHPWRKTPRIRGETPQSEAKTAAYRPIRYNAGSTCGFAPVISSATSFPVPVPIEIPSML